MGIINAKQFDLQKAMFLNIKVHALKCIYSKLIVVFVCTYRQLFFLLAVDLWRQAEKQMVRLMIIVTFIILEIYLEYYSTWRNGSRFRLQW